ncbi:hypothetical protein D3C73_1546710 [compost metagenome]
MDRYTGDGVGFAFSIQLRSSAFVFKEIFFGKGDFFVPFSRSAAGFHAVFAIY